MKTENEMKEILGFISGFGKPLLAAVVASGSTVLSWCGLISPYVAFATVCVAFISACLHLWHRWKIIKEDDLRIKKLLKD